MSARSFLTGVLTLAAVAAVSPAPSARTLAEPYDVKGTETWRASRAKDLQSDSGWLTVAGLFFLKPGPNLVGSDPASDVLLPVGSAPARAGTLIRETSDVWFEAEPGAEVKLNGVPVQAKIALRPSARVTTGRVTFFLHSSGDRLAVRVRDPENPLRRTFHGLQWYPIRADWRITGTFRPYDSPRPVAIQNVLGDIERYVSPGEVAFEVKGAPVTLQAVRSGQRLWFIFSDATAGRETYRIRFLYADGPGPDAKVVLDFNRAYNPPCAYNPYTTCPRPPAGNFLKAEIRAGEKKY